MMVNQAQIFHREGHSRSVRQSFATILPISSAAFHRLLSLNSMGMAKGKGLVSFSADPSHRSPGNIVVP